MTTVLIMAAAAFLQGPHAAVQAREQCLTCHGGASADTSGGEGPRTRFSMDESALGAPWNAHADVECVECHTSIGRLSTPAEAVPPEFAPLVRAVEDRFGSTVASAIVGCRSCHPEAFEAWAQSIHARALVEGIRPGTRPRVPPTCIDCHGHHDIRFKSDPDARTHPTHQPEVCARCHSLQKVVSTYEESVHGQKQRLWNAQTKVRVAVCGSCHHYHDIPAVDAPNSPVNPENKPQTCAQCHPGASAKFAESYTHRRIEDSIILRVVRAAYFIIIGGTVSALGLFVLTDLVRILRLWRRRIPVVHEPSGEMLPRWSLWVRCQHWMLVLTFAALSVTGVPLLFPRAPTSVRVMAWFGGADGAAQVHRAGAAGMILVSIAHVLWILYRIIIKRDRKSPMIPRPRDVAHAFQLALFTAGLRRVRPRIGRYGPVEKFEYWALAWGTLVMAATGLVLWAPVVAAYVIGGLAIQVAQVIHGYEAILAVLAILIWHMYHAHLCPEFWPMSRVWLTGRISREALAELHPVELEEMEDAGVAARGEDDARIP